jgi:hypothetical protein
MVATAAKREFLGGFELLVLLAVIRLGDDAYGVPIANAIENSSQRRVSLGSLYLRLVLNGRTISRIMVAGYTADGDSFSADRPRVGAENLAVIQYAGGTAEPPPVSRLTFLLNFFDELKRRVPAK